MKKGSLSVTIQAFVSGIDLASVATEAVMGSSRLTLRLSLTADEESVQALAGFAKEKGCKKLKRKGEIRRGRNSSLAQSESVWL